MYITQMSNAYSRYASWTTLCVIILS